MLKISDVTLESIKSIGIERVVEQYVDLRGRPGSRDLWACCPFHNETTPSFKIDTERGFFKCFGCDAKGDSVTFIMRKLGFTYPDALIFLAEKFGINIEYVGSENKHSKDIIALHEDIQVLLRKNLYAESGKVALDYILGRSFNEEDLDLFGLGFCPPRLEYSKIIDKYSKEVILNCGYFKENSYGGVSPRFFNRLTLPIKNITGSIAAFAGRSIDGSNPKYLNSAESDVFHKRGTLFNMDKAKDSIKKNGCIVVEGYFDVMRLHKCGFRNAVAPMGTALTADQITFIKRYSSEIAVIFDGDEAGIKAAYRSLEHFINAGVFPKAVFLPKEDDPDSFLRSKGAGEFAKIYEERSDLFLDVAKRLAKSAGNDFGKKLSRFQSVRKMLAKIDDPHFRDYYSGAAADIFDLKKENIDEDIERMNSAPYVSVNAGVAPGSKNKYAPDIDIHAEKIFIAYLTHLPMDVIMSLIGDMTPEMFKNDEIKEIFKKILEVSPNITDINEIMNELGEGFIELAMRELPGENHYEEALSNKKQIEKNHLMKRLRELILKQKSEISDEEKLIVMQEIQKLSELIAGS